MKKGNYDVCKRLCLIGGVTITDLLKVDRISPLQCLIEEQRLDLLRWVALTLTKTRELTEDGQDYVMVVDKELTIADGLDCIFAVFRPEPMIASMRTDIFECLVSIFNIQSFETLVSSTSGNGELDMLCLILVAAWSDRNASAQLKYFEKFFDEEKYCTLMPRAFQSVFQGAGMPFDEKIKEELDDMLSSMVSKASKRKAPTDEPCLEDESEETAKPDAKKIKECDEVTMVTVYKKFAGVNEGTTRQFYVDRKEVPKELEDHVTNEFTQGVSIDPQEHTQTTQGVLVFDGCDGSSKVKAALEFIAKLEGTKVPQPLSCHNFNVSHLTLNY